MSKLVDLRWRNRDFVETAILRARGIIRQFNFDSGRGGAFNDCCGAGPSSAACARRDACPTPGFERRTHLRDYAEAGRDRISERQGDDLDCLFQAIRIYMLADRIADFRSEFCVADGRAEDFVVRKIKLQYVWSLCDAPSAPNRQQIE